MKTIIYYFTGTGNSLAAAKKIAVVLEDCELVPIGSLMETPGDIIPTADRVGIVCPVYFSGLPAMVAAFAGRLRLAGSGYLFAVVTFGGGLGAGSTLRQLDGIFRRHLSRGLDAGFTVKMPGNYILMYEPPAGEERHTVLAAADSEIARIADTIKQSRKQEFSCSFSERLVHPLAYTWFISRVHTEDRKFTVTDSCTSCGICAAVCPAENIDLVAGKPVWKHHCELCCGCIHLCPVQAILAGAKTEKWLRYRNPDVTVAELKIREENGL